MLPRRRAVCGLCLIIRVARSSLVRRASTRVVRSSSGLARSLQACSGPHGHTHVGAKQKARHSETVISRITDESFALPRRICSTF